MVENLLDYAVFYLCMEDLTTEYEGCEAEQIFKIAVSGLCLSSCIMKKCILETGSISIIR